MPPTLSIIVPAFNEARRLPRLLQQIASSAPPTIAAAGLHLLEVLIVDDGSTDETAALVEASPEPVRLIRVGPPNLGKGTALATGLLEAKGDLALLCDVDLSTPLADVSQLYAAMSAGADIAVGSRAVHGATVSGVPLSRSVGSRAFSVATRVVTGLRVGDTQRGFKLLRTESACDLCSERLVDGFAWDVELLLRAQLAGLRIVEVPVTYHHDDDSTVGAAAALRSFWDVVRLRRLRHPSDAPR